MSTANRVAKNTGILYAKMGITVFISLYTTRLILTSLGVEDFGIFNLVGGAIAMLTFLNAAMAHATQRFMSFATGEGNNEKQKKIFNVSLVLHIFTAIIIVTVLEVVGHFLFKNVFKIPFERVESAKLVYQFMVISTAFTIISVPYDAVINARENMFLLAILGIVESILKLCIALFVMYTLYDKLVAFGMLTAILSIFLLTVRRIYCHRNYNECEINIFKFFDKVIYRDLSAFAAWSFLGASSSMLTGYGQGIVINSFFGPVVNAAQGIANQVSGQLGVFASTMLQALNPIIDKSEGAGDRSLMLKASMFGSKISFLLLMLCFIPVLIDMPYIFKLWLKQVPEYAVIFCRLLLVKNLIEQLFITLSGSIAAVGDIKKFKISTSILNALPLIISYLLFANGFPAYNIYIVFIGFSICIGILTIYFAKLICGLSIKEYSIKILLRCIVSFLIVAFFSYVPVIYMKENLVRLLLIIGINCSLFLIVSWLIAFTSEEKMIIKKFIHKILQRLNPLIDQKPI